MAKPKLGDRSFAYVSLPVCLAVVDDFLPPHIDRRRTDHPGEDAPVGEREREESTCISRDLFNRDWI